MMLKTNKQQLAFDKLSRLKVGALFMEMGTGKTKVALDLVASKYDKVDYILWICPFSTKHEIESEKLKWHPELKINIIGCESIGSSDRIFVELLRKIANKKVFCVVDESLKIKNSKAKRTQRILKIGEMSSYRLILNGTPVSKNVMDLWTQMYFLSPRILNMTELDFKNTFCEYYLHGRLKGLVKKTYNTEYLMSLIRPYIFDSKLDLEVKTRYENIYYPNININEYQDIKYESLNIYKNTLQFDFFAFSTKLQRCYTKSYVSILKEIIKKIDGQVIVYVKFLDNIPANEHKITGKENIKERKEVLEKFKNNEFKVLYMSYGVGSFGLNLQYCNNIIFADQTFDYAQKVQSEHRIFRLGQNKNVHYYNLICLCGMDKMIQMSLNKKSNLLQEIKKEIEKKGTEKWIKSL